MIQEPTLTTKRPLPSEDIANIAPLPLPEQRKRLKSLFGRPTISYRSVRSVENDVWGLPLSLPFSLSKPTLDEILAAVVARSRRGKERESCLELVRLFHALLQEEQFLATPREFGSLQLALGVSVDYCADVVLGTSVSSPLVAGVNYRRRPYTTAGLRFAFSAMHEQSRALDRDLHTARLAIIQFPHPPKKARYASLAFADDVELIEYRRLAEMAAATSELWDEMQEQRAEKARRTGTDDQDWWGGD